MGNAIPTYHVCIKTNSETKETVCTKHAYDATAANQIATLSGFDSSKIELVPSSSGSLPGNSVDLSNLPNNNQPRPCQQLSTKANSMKDYLQCELKCRHLAQNFSQPLAQKTYYELCILNCENK